MSCDSKRPATFFLSIDVAHACEDSPVVADIHEVMRRRHIKGLWSFAFQRHPEVIGLISSSANDIGLLGDVDWVGPNCDRTVLARELLARLNRATELGLKPIALALNNGDAPSHLDLLVKHQLAILRTRTDRVAADGQCFQPRLARYGIWEAEPTLLIPATSRWSLPWTVRRIIHRAIDQQQTLHVAVNIAALVQHGSGGLASLDYVLKLVTARREAGLLRVVSPREMLDLYHPRRELVASRSVLKAA